MKYQKPNCGGPAHNVIDSEGKSGSKVKLKVLKREREQEKFRLGSVL